MQFLIATHAEEFAKGIGSETPHTNKGSRILTTEILEKIEQSKRPHSEGSCIGWIPPLKCGGAGGGRARTGKLTQRKRGRGTQVNADRRQEHRTPGIVIRERGLL